MSNTNSGTETYAEKVDRIAVELLDVLRDVLGPKRRLSKPLAAYARYEDHAVTVTEGAGPRSVELTAHLTAAGAIKGYSARLIGGDLEPGLRPTVGPARIDCTEDPEEYPTLTYVLPLVVRLECGAERMRAARAALEAIGRQVEDCGSSVLLREPCARGTRTAATVELDPDNGALRVHGRDAGEVCKTLRKAGIF